MANAQIILDITVDGKYDQLRLGFLKADNPTAWKRLNSMAALNAARSIQKPMRAAAPRGRTTDHSGKLQRAVKARTVRWGKPGAVVGIKGGRSGVHYGWFVTEGRGTTRRTNAGPVNVKGVRGRPFVVDTIKQEGIINQANEAFAKTIEAFLNNDVFRGTVLQFRRGGQLRGMGVSGKDFFGMIGKLVRY